MSDREVDFGHRWLVGDAAGGEPWRLTWAGGQLVAVCLARPHRVELLAANIGLDEARERLEGWQDRCGRANSLAWAILAGAQHARPGGEAITENNLRDHHRGPEGERLP